MVAAEILYTSQESIFPKVVKLICTEKEGRGFDQNSLSTGGLYIHSRQVCAWVVQELLGTPAESSPRAWPGEEH